MSHYIKVAVCTNCTFWSKWSIMTILSKLMSSNELKEHGFQIFFHVLITCACHYVYFTSLSSSCNLFNHIPSTICWHHYEFKLNKKDHICPFWVIYFQWYTILIWWDPSVLRIHIYVNTKWKGIWIVFEMMRYIKRYLNINSNRSLNLKLKYSFYTLAKWIFLMD